MVWLGGEWNEPSRTDHYLIQIASEIRRGNVKRPRSVKHEHLKIKFVEKGSKPTSPMTKELAAKLSKARWVARMGMPVQVVTVPPNEE